MEIIERIYTDMYDVFWSEKFWFPKNCTWETMTNKETGPFSHIEYTKSSQLYWTIPVALLLLLLRYVFETHIMQPIAGLFGLKETSGSKRPKTCPKLDEYFLKNRRPKDEEIEQLASDLGWSAKQTQNWFRLKRNQQKSSRVKKFCECGWRFVFYFGMFVYGLYVLYDEDFFYDFSKTQDMRTWPHHHVKNEFFYYYILEMGFYMSLLVSLFRDVKRHDFVEHSIHHVLTLSLMWFSWTLNFVRLGLIVLILHDPADSWLEATKMARYVGMKKLAHTLLSIFTIIWLLTRTIIYPFYVVYPGWTMYYAMKAEIGHAYSIFLNLLCMSLLVVLNLIWTGFILASVHNVFVKHHSHDARSDSESEMTSSDEQNGVCRNGHANGLKEKYN